MFQTVRGLVIRTVDYREADIILTVLTDEMGIVTVKARGARRKGSRAAPSCRLFAFSNMALSERQGRFTLGECDPIELFTGLAEQLENMALACYFSEIIGSEGEGNRQHSDVFRLMLNSLFALAQRLRPAELIKAAFELRFSALTGYEPAFDECGECGEELDSGWFSLSGGRICCGSCRDSDALPLDAASLSAARYILSAQLNRLFSFTIPPPSMTLLGTLCEKYLETCLERGFKTLKYYKSIGELQ